MAALPLQDQIDRTSGPKSQGFLVNQVSYSSKVSQKAFDGPSQEASRDEVWTVRWKLLQRLSPQEELDTGETSTYDLIKDFYENNYLSTVEWQPFEIDRMCVWEIVPNSLKQSNKAGCIFELSFDLKLLYRI